MGKVGENWGKAKVIEKYVQSFSAIGNKFLEIKIKN